MKNSPTSIPLPGFALPDLVEEAIDFLRQHEPREGYYLGFSGGKDSIVCYNLCKMAGVQFYPYYSCTRIDPPEIYAFIKQHYPDVQWLFPKKSFWRMVVEKQPPMRHIRWCCAYLKKAPAAKIPLKTRIMGIRAEESVARAKWPRLDYNERLKQTLVKPIFYWPEWAVWEFIDKYKLPYPSLYDDGFSRIGCVTCPMIFGKSSAAIKRLELYQTRWPGLWKCFKSACKKWFKKIMSDGKLRGGQTCKTFSQFWQRYLSGELK